MATDFSPPYVAASRRRLRLTPLWFQMKFWKVIKKWRMLRRRFASKLVRQDTAPCALTANLDAAATHFQKHTWAFVEDVLSPDFHAELIRNWPKKWHLDPPRKLEKSYNIGFSWVYGKEPDFSHYDPYGQYPGLVKFLNYMRMSETAQRVKRVTGCPLSMVCNSFLLTDAREGSEVIPHVDNIQYDEHAANFVNMVFFINAAEGPRSGALTLSRDNELRDIIFEPPCLKNTMLMYNSLADYYHGFAPIAKGKFRWTIAVQFCAKKYFIVDTLNE